MLNLLRRLNRNFVLVIPASMAGGLVFGRVFNPAPLKAFIPVFTFLMVFPMMVTLQYREAFTKCSWLSQGTAQLTNFIILPILAYGLGGYFFPDQQSFALGLLLMALIPTSGMTVSWTGLAGGNVEVAVKMMIFGLLTGSIAAPFYISFLLGARISVDIAMILTRIFLIVVLPMAAGFTTRQLLLRLYGKEIFTEKIGPAFPPWSALGVIGMVFTAIALRAHIIFSRPLLLVEILIPVLLFYLFVIITGVYLGHMLLSRSDAIALIYGTSLRNLSIALAIAVNALGKAGMDAALVLSAAFIVQTQVAVWSTRFVDRLFPGAVHEP